MRFFSNSHSDRYRLLLDISSGAVSIAIIRIVGDEMTVVWSHTELIRLGKGSVDQSTLNKSMLTSLMQALMELQTTGRRVEDYNNILRKIEDFECVLSSLWLDNFILPINYKDKNKFTVTNDLIANLVEEAKEKALVQAKDLGTVIYQNSDNWQLNGYSVDKVQNKSIEEIQFSLYLSVIDNLLFKKINELCQKTLPKLKITYTPRYVALSTLLPNRASESSVIIDFDKTVLELITIRRGKVIEILPYRKGMQSVIELLAIELKIPSSQLISTFYNNDLYQSFTNNQKVSATIEKVRNDFKKDFLKEFPSHNFLVATDEVYVYHDRPLGQFWIDFLNHIIPEHYNPQLRLTELSQLNKDKYGTRVMTSESFPQTRHEKSA